MQWEEQSSAWPGALVGVVRTGRLEALMLPILSARNPSMAQGRKALGGWPACFLTAALKVERELKPTS